jgi:hypothetical protein
VAVPLGSFPTIEVSGNNQDAIYHDGLKSEEFDPTADSYAVRWSIPKSASCRGTLILHETQSEKQTPIEFGPIPSINHSGAFNLRPVSKVKHSLTIQTDKNCGPGTWKVTFTRSESGNGKTTVLHPPPSDLRGMAESYCRVFLTDFDDMRTYLMKLANDCGKRGNADCTADFVGLSPQADKFKQDLDPLDVPTCLESGNGQVHGALDTLKSGSRDYQSAVLFRDNGGINMSFDEVVDGTRDLISAKSCIDASC